MGIENPSITFFIATTGRRTMSNTLRSLYGQFNRGVDKIEVFFDGPTFTDAGPEYFQPEKDMYGEDLIFHVLPQNLGCYGHCVRNAYQGSFHTDYIHHADDDDSYYENVMPQVRTDMKENFGKLIMYKFQNTDGIQWHTQEIKHGNIGTPSGLIPNNPAIMGHWGEWAGGDAHFYMTTIEKLGIQNVVWKNTVIYRVRPHVFGW